MTGVANVAASGNQDIDGLLSGTKWNTTTLTYSFPASRLYYNYSGEPNDHFEQFNLKQQAVVKGFYQAIEAVTNLHFVQVTETFNTTADLRFGMTDDTDLAHAYYPSPAEQGGDAWFKNTGGEFDDPDKGEFAHMAILHEMGHTLGLKHGHDTDTYGPLPTNHDSNEYSVMTYRSYVGSPGDGVSVMEGDAPQGLMLDDIAALQYMYGANFNSNSGNTTYSWSPTTGEMFINGGGQGASTNNTILITVWDGGGTDTYDLSNYTTDLDIDLHPGEWTTTASNQLSVLGYNANLGGYQYARANIANAWLYQGNTASLIENATGGTGADTIHGNTAANTLSGNGGSDSLFGEEGNDTLAGASGNDSLDGGDGNDLLYGGLGVDDLLGGNGNDNLYVNGNDAQLDGGAGYDQVIVLDTAGVNITIESGVEYVAGNSGNDVLSAAGTSTAIVIGGAEGNDTLTGGSAADTLAGGDNADQLSGGAGADIIFGGTGADNFFGGDGDDKLYILGNDGTIDGGNGYDQAIILDIGGVSITLGSGTEYAAGNSGNDTIDASALALALTIGGAGGNDTVRGGSAGDILSGSTGTDTIFGNGGNDQIFGGDGNDALYGGAGNDQLTTGNGSDVCFIEDNAGTDAVFGFVDGLDFFNFSLDSTVHSFSDLSISATGSDVHVVFTGGELIIFGAAGLIDSNDFAFT